MKNTFLGVLVIALSLASFASNAETVIIVSSQSDVNALNADEAERIFLGKIGNFPNGRTAIALDLPPGPERNAFYEKISRKNETQMKSYWARRIFSGKELPPKEAKSEAEMIELVARNPNTVGYIDSSKLNGTVKKILTIQ